MGEVRFPKYYMFFLFLVFLETTKKVDLSLVFVYKDFLCVPLVKRNFLKCSPDVLY